MKNTIKTVGIIALAAVIGFSMLACDDGNGDDPTVTALTSPGLYKAAGAGTYTRISEVAANDVAAAITRFVASGSANNGEYFLVINQNVTLSARQTVNENSSTPETRKLTIIGLGQERTITAPAAGAFSVMRVTLTLGENITLSGVNGMTGTLISVSNNGNVTMKAGSKITKFSTTDASNRPTPVAVNQTGTFIMDGGEISGNSVDIGTSNNASSAGVLVNGSNSTFIMNGGTITGNAVVNGPSTWGGGGVCLGTSGTAGSPSRFTMNGGTITLNTRNSDPRDVHIPNNAGAIFTYNNGTIGALFDKTGEVVAKP